MPRRTPSAASGLDFGSLVRQHQAMVFSIAWHLLRDRAVAEELAQDVFLSLYQHLAELESPEHVQFWLRRVTSNRALDVARRRQRRPMVSLENAPEPVAMTPTGDPLLGTALKKLVAALPEKARAIVVLRYQEDLDPAEIARVLGIPVGTVKSQLQRALGLLREKLSRVVGQASGLSPGKEQDLWHLWKTNLGRHCGAASPRRISRSGCWRGLPSCPCAGRHSHGFAGWPPWPPRCCWPRGAWNTAIIGVSAPRTRSCWPCGSPAANSTRRRRKCKC